jgi:hypothetical protein
MERERERVGLSACVRRPMARDRVCTFEGTAVLLY